MLFSENVTMGRSLPRQGLKYLRRSATLSVISAVAGGNLLTSVLGLIGSFVQARFVTPADLGYFRSFAIVTGYAFFLHLGLFDALQRFYPYYVGRGEKNRALAIAEICQAWNVSVSAIVSCVFVCLAAWSLVFANWRAMLGWFVQACAVAASIYGGYLGATYRAGHEFKTATKGPLFSSIGSLFILPLFALWPYVAMAARSGLSSLMNLVYLHFRRPLHLRWRFSWGEWLNLFRNGFPIFVASFGAGTLWTTVESTIVLKDLGTIALGLWSVSFFFVDTANKVPQAIVAVYVPRVIENLGRTASVRDSFALCKKPILWGLAASLIIVGVGWTLLPAFISILVPNYVAAIP